MMKNSIFDDKLELFEDFANIEINRLPFYLVKSQGASTVHVLMDSIKYSFFNGGKRFRPLLCLNVAEFLGLDFQNVLPWSLALEMIHTYSLIHDDLPCMDNDDFRRGKPTNHKVFGEGTALLAGDSLLTESFGILAEHYFKEAEVFSQLVTLLRQISGVSGMIGGQHIDMTIEKENQGDFEKVIKMHELKTGALISGCLTGPAIIKKLHPEVIFEMTRIGINLGLLFQIKDDFLDFDKAKFDPKNILYHCESEVIGIQFMDQLQVKTLTLIQNLVEKLNLPNSHQDYIKNFILWNQERSV